MNNSINNQSYLYNQHYSYNQPYQCYQYNNVDYNHLKSQITLLNEQLRYYVNENTTLKNSIKNQNRYIKNILNKDNRKNDENDSKNNSDKKKKNVCYFPNKFSYSKDEINNLFKNINNIEDIINLPNDIYIKHNKFLRKLIDIREPLKKLNEMIGLKDIKSEIFKHIIYFIINSNKLNENKRLHTIIQGPPGVGKTQFAKILADIYLNIGFLDNNIFNTVKRSDLIGGYLGQTAILTQEAIDKSIGGVLFIDEAYSLGNKDHNDTYSKECIDTINRNLTENGNKFICIIAGYEKDLEECFFKNNDGLKRRFNFKYTINSYNSREMSDICKLKINQESWNHNIHDRNFDLFFENNKLPYYGGDIDRLLFHAQLNASFRLFNQNKFYDKIITMDDLILSIDALKDERVEDERWKDMYY